MARRIRVFAPAKVNLHLGVGPRLEDGYHRLDAVFHALDLTDDVVLEDAEALSLTCSPDFGVPVEQNLAWRAALAFGRATGHAPDFRITLVKNIPHGAGLGGGSSDAAAVIAGLAHAWDIDRRDPACLAAAAAVGADVPFFLHGGAALMGGRGDVLVRHLPASEADIVLLKPTRSISTADAYRAFDARPVAAESSGAVVAALEAGDAAALGRALENNFVPVAVALVPECGHALTWLSAQPGVLGATVAGSGSAVFAVVEDAEKAHHVAERARAFGWWTAATRLRAQGICVSDEEGDA